MPLPRRRSSFLGPPSERAVTTPAVHRGAFLGGVPGVVSSGPGARVSRRALGISSVFLQGLRSSAVPLVQRAGRTGSSQGLDGCLVEYRDKVSEAILDNARLMLQTENVQASTEDFKDRYNNEQPFRRAMEEEISSLHKVMEEAGQTRVHLEQQMNNMRAEIQDLDQNHEEDVRVVYHQMAGLDLDESEAPIKTNLDQILAHIRSRWEKVIERNRAETDNYLEYKDEGLGSQMSPGQEELEDLKTECSESGCRVQSLQAETESIRALKRGLENSLGDARHWHAIELQNLGSVVGRLEAELSEVHGDVEEQRRGYDALLGDKTRLEQEIAAYHGILDREESRYQPRPGTAQDA
ncbi:hypothetical protein NHX12_002908 [Muraenolepis orangiensis]|uniref:IF rod domain-containing protein n=1 Tax=Muraenolepis orangiensis TaxID=630683 RepID=A0A9Q0IGR7_9TELE|nr:hypothetical protein NHX12_002908 [Muraenolepis orangiensis]